MVYLGKSKPLLHYSLWLGQLLHSTLHSNSHPEDNNGVEAREEIRVEGSHPEANIAFRGPACPEEEHKAHPKEEVTKGEAQFKKTPFASTVTKNTTNRKIADLELETMPRVTVQMVPHFTQK